MNLVRTDSSQCSQVMTGTSICYMYYITHSLRTVQPIKSLLSETIENLCNFCPHNAIDGCNNIHVSYCVLS